jgi:peptidyl-prolyl cis-trans isomerase SurA
MTPRGALRYARAAMRCPAIFVAFALALVVPPAGAAPRLVERIVAVVNDAPILRSELRARAAPHQAKLDLAEKDAAKRAKLRAELTRTVLARMIDERLEQAEAARRGLSVTEEDLARAMAMIAASQKVTLEQLEQAVRDSGLSVEAYRAEVAHQILEGKLIRVYAGDRLPRNVPEQQLMEAIAREQAKLVEELRAGAYVDVRL